VLLESPKREAVLRNFFDFVLFRNAYMQRVTATNLLFYTECFEALFTALGLAVAEVTLRLLSLAC
jgi:hypothetical protein